MRARIVFPFVFFAFSALTPWHALAEGGEDGDEEVPVAFDGDEEIELDEGETEVFFEEEGGAAPEADRPPINPEHDRSRWLFALPLLCAALLMGNVEWRVKGSKGTRRSR